MTKSPAEKRLVDTLRKAEVRRRMRELSTFGVYVVCVNGGYTLPFFAPADNIAVQSFESMIHDEHLESLVPELYCIGSYCTIDGKLRSHTPRFLPYQLLASRRSGSPECAKGRRPQIKRTTAAVCDTVSC